MSSCLDSFATRGTIKAGGIDYTLFSLKKLMENGHLEVARLPLTLKVLLENLLRFEDGDTVTAGDVTALLAWPPMSRARPRFGRPSGQGARTVPGSDRQHC